MKDFIFIIGPSGVGKTTLAKGLFKHLDVAGKTKEEVLSNAISIIDNHNSLLDYD